MSVRCDVVFARLLRLLRPAGANFEWVREWLAPFGPVRHHLPLLADQRENHYAALGTGRMMKPVQCTKATIIQARH